MPTPKQAALTASALVAFAANSLICRLALRTGSIDPAGFTAIRLFSGAVILVLVVAALGKKSKESGRGSWLSAAALFLYAAGFSFAYVSLDAGIGALVLFGAVQLTMLGGALLAGERLGASRWAGVFLAVAGLAWLLLPGSHAPSPLGFALMAAAGGSWGIYSLRGRKSAAPVAATAGNFLLSVPLGLALAAVYLSGLRFSLAGILWAVLSGAVTSGLGYVLWYAAVRRLSAGTAAVVQLAVPVLAAAGGVVLLSEPLTSRLVLSSIVVLGGVFMATRGAR